jgi:excisionase family DNA binding protein
MNPTEINNKLEGIFNVLREKSSQQREILNIQQAAEYLSLSRSHLYKLTCNHLIPFYKPTGKKIFFKKIDLDSWMLRNRHATTEEIETASANHLISKPRK